MSNKILVNFFNRGMNLDALPAQQPEGTHRYAENVVKDTDQYGSGFLTQEGSTEVCFKIPGDFILRGSAFIEERDKFLMFLYNPLTNVSEVGLGDVARCNYEKLFNDQDKSFEGKLCFGEDEWIHIELKYVQPCNQIKAYWSNKSVFRHFNIDDHCGITERKTQLFRCICGPRVEPTVSDKGGVGLKAGTYQFFLRLSDEDGNVTNWFDVGERVRIGSENNIPGEPSEESILVKIEDLDTEYSRVEIAVLSTIEGVEHLEKITSKSYNSNGLTFTYYGSTGEEETLSPDEVRAKKDQYFRGKRLIQYDGRLVLYRIQESFNINMQREVNHVKSKYVVWRIPVQDAHKYPSLARGEVYAFGVVYKYCDGTYSEVFHIPGRTGTLYDFEETDGTNCTLCERPRWQTENTAYRTQVYTSKDILTEVADSVKNRDEDYLPENPYTPYDQDKEVKDLITKGSDFVSAWNSDVQEAEDGAEDCFCSDSAGGDDGTTPVYGPAGGGQDGGAGGNFGCPNGTCSSATCGSGCATCGNTPIGGSGTLGGDATMQFSSVGGGNVDLSADAAAGRIVLIDFFATWCGPCWSYANTGILTAVQNNFGGQVSVYAFEGDTATSDDAINGIGNTQGNYANLMGYPIVNLTSTELLQRFGVAGFPTVIALYPDGTFTALGQPSYEAIESLINNNAPPQGLGQYEDNVGGCGQGGGCSSCGGSLSGCGSCSGAGCGSGGTCRPLYGDPFSLKLQGGRSTQRSVNFNQPILSAMAPPPPEEITQDDLTFEPIYDETGCRIVGYKPLRYAEGKCAYWQSRERYPLTTDCEGNFVWGSEAGQYIRHHKMPSTTLEPHFISFQNGVITKDYPENHETNDGFVHVLGMKFWDIPLPKKTPKPLCPNSPYKIVYVKRDNSNKSMLAKGLFIDTFKGEVFGEEYAIPKNGVNSLEFFDRYINYNDQSQERAGVKNDVPGYVFHSPDMNFNKPFLGAQEADIELEVFGAGRRHGLYEKGLETNSWWVPVTHQRGARQSVHLNKYAPPAGVTLTRDPNGSGTDPVDCGSISFRVTQRSCTVFPTEPTDVSATYAITGINAADIVSFSLQAFYSGTLIEEINTPILAGGIASNTIATGDRRIIGEYRLTIRTSSCLYTSVVGLVTHVDNFEGDCEMTRTVVVEGSDITENDPGGNINVIGTEGTMTRCIRGISYAPANSIVNKSNKFTHSLLNLHRESSVYVEFTEGKLTLRNNIDRFLIDSLYNGRAAAPNSELQADATCDGSFFGDVFTHEYPIYLNSAWYGSLRRELPSQYGRVEGLIYHDFGVVADAEAGLCGRVEGIGGDVFISPYSLKRTSYISDHVGDNLRRPVELENGWGAGSNARGGGRAGKLVSWFRRVIANFLGLNEAYGLETCGVPPISRDEPDPKNSQNGLRDNFQSRYSWNGLQLFVGKYLGRRRVYYPAVLNTLVTFWVESETVVPLRQTGEDRSQYAYPKLKELAVDSSLRRNSGWEIGWLNRTYAELKEVTPWKKFAVILAHIFAKVILPIILFIQLFKIASSSVIGPIIAIVAALIFIVIIVVVIIVFTKYIDRILGIRQCRTDADADRDADGAIRQLEDNYHAYNLDYSRINDFQPYVGVTDPYFTCVCDEKTSNRIVLSDKQMVSSLIDAYRNYRVNNFLDIPPDAGSLQRMFLLQKNLFAQTSDGIYNLQGGDSALEVSGDTVFLGRGDVLNRAYRLYSGIPEGFGGTLDNNASVSTRFGYATIDEESRALYFFNGQEFKAVSSLGVRNFLKENLYLRLVEQFPGFKFRDVKHPKGVGFSIGFDPRLDRVLLTKVDYEALNPDSIVLRGANFYNKTGERIELTDTKHFRNKSFTLSYYPADGFWLSFHSYKPGIYLWDRNKMLSLQDNVVYKHNSNESYLRFYGKDHAFQVEYIATTEDREPFEFVNTIYETEAIRNYNGSYIRNLPITFTNTLFYNTHQSSGNLEVIHKTPLGSDESTPKIGTTFAHRLVGNNWRVNDVSSRVISDESAIMQLSESGIYEEVNEQNIGKKKEERFVDNYLVNRVSFANYPNTRVILKRVKTLVKPINLY